MIGPSRPPEFSGLQFAIGSVRGSRSFYVNRETGALQGCVYRQEWVDGENVAHCYRLTQPYYPPTVIGPKSPSIFEGWLPEPRVYGPGHPEHDMPGCTCGFYGYFDARDEFARDWRVSGIVQGYGETLIGTLGFRCAKARILAITLPNPDEIFRGLSPEDYRNIWHSKEPPLTDEDHEKIRARYPSVKVYRTRMTMLRNHPPDPAVIPPGEDEDEEW